MLDIIFTILTMILTPIAFMAVWGFMRPTLAAGAANVAIVSTLAGIGVALASLIPFEMIDRAWAAGSATNNPFAFHWPKASEFWLDYLPATIRGVLDFPHRITQIIGTWQTHPIIAVGDGLALAVFAAALFMLVWGFRNITDAVGMVGLGGVVFVVIVQFSLTAFAMTMPLFLVAYILATAMVSLKFALFILLLSLFGGGGTAIYNSRGEKIGEVYDR